MRYKCIKAFSVPTLDEDLYEEVGSYYVRKGSVWELTDEHYINVDIHLEKEDGNWIEISNERFKECFEEVRW